MLKNFIVHLKNVIFFKFIMCCLCISTILWLLQSINKDYMESIAKNQNIEESLAQETLKLYSIINSKYKILETYARYSKLLSISARQSCLERARLITTIDSFSKKYNLNEPITISIKQEFLSGINPMVGTKQDTIRIKNYDVYIRFATKDFATFLTIIKEIYSCMPENTIVLSIDVKKEDVLEPKVVYKLSTERIPDMIFTKLNMRIREITANK
ncbi:MULTISPECIES: hypothetical protein [unclassified Candidatus Tisiphia]|jgi:hypothetical protein|uniref:hypothetical protein n=1 Tax=unclassified Candidatus Tisiphia TaxID=2996318 RepID=UPI001E701AB8|nr:MAG: hypothetical protein LF884_01785 [Rickettsia endosymbiont of Cimex lectularius]